MKRVLLLSLFLGSLALINSCGGSDTQTPMPTPDPNNPPTDEVITLTFSAASSADYTLEQVEGVTGVATPGADPELTLTVGKRYRIVNQALGAHPFALSSSPTYSAANLLLKEDGTGSFVTDTMVNYVKNTDGFSFTLTQALADQLKSYLCTFHSSMFGTIKVTAQ
jgi:plastocyanin